MKILQMALKGEYFDQIKAGTKVEEYRLVNEYWTRRLVCREYNKLILTRGYPHKNDQSRRLEFNYAGCIVKTVTHPHFGPEPVKVYAIQIENQQQTHDILAVLKEVQQCCLFSDDNDTIGVTEEPHIPIELFNKICEVIKKHDK